MSGKRLQETPSQTAGPYLHIGLMPNAAGIPGVFESDPGATMIGETAKGRRIRLNGTIYDGSGEPVKDALVELWQADAAGLYPARYSAPDFTGWGRVATDSASGTWAVETVKPGRVPYGEEGGFMAPHVSLWIVARGINIGLHTRLYFPDEAEANAEDPILANIAPASRAETLIAEKTGGAEYRFDIHLQGERETVFFDV